MTPKRDATTKVERPRLYIDDDGAVCAAYIQFDADAYMDQQDARVRELEGLLRDVLVITDRHITCDVVMEGPRYGISLHAKLAQSLKSIEERISAALGEKNV